MSGFPYQDGHPGVSSREQQQQQQQQQHQQQHFQRQPHPQQGAHPQLTGMTGYSIQGYQPQSQASQHQSTGSARMHGYAQPQTYGTDSVALAAPINVSLNPP